MLYVGDKETNRYTDAAIEDIKSRIKTDFELDYYGGSTYIPHDVTTIRLNQSMPYICIDTDAHFTFNCIQYHIKNTDGAVNTYRHDFINTLPYVYGITAYIYYNDDTEDKAKIIEKQLRSEYAGEVQIWVDVPNGSGKKSTTILRVDAANCSSKDADIYHCKLIKFVPYYSVYFWQEYNRENIADNPAQQFALLQATELALLTFSKLTKNAIRLYEIDYRALITHQKLTVSLLPQSFREVKERFDSGQPIDRTLFERTFANIVNVYPQLYDYFMQGMSYEQILSDMKNRAEILAQRYVQLCNDLQLPESLSGDYDVVLKCRNLDSIQLLINKMVKKDTRLDKMISICLKELEDKKLSEIQQDQESRERVKKEAECLREDENSAENPVIKAMREKFYDGVNDVSISRYIDAVIKYLRTAFADYPELNIYCDDVVKDWVTLYEGNKAHFPTLFVSAEAMYRARSAHDQYTNMTNNGETVVHEYSKTVLPLRLLVTIQAFAESDEEIEKIYLTLMEAGHADKKGDPVVLTVPDPQYVGENIVFKFQLSNKEYSVSKECIEGTEKPISYMKVRADGYSAVPDYHRILTKEELNGNPQKQVQMLKKLLFYIEYQKLEYDATSQLLSDYRDIFTGRKRFFGFLDSAEYKKLRETLAAGLPIERELFNKALSKVTEVYPLYNRMMSGTAYESMMAELEDQKDYFNSCFLQQCEAMSIPAKLKVRYSGYADQVGMDADPRSKMALDHYLFLLEDRGFGSNNNDIAFVIEEYRELLASRTDEYQRELEIQYEYEAANSEEQSSSGGGFFSNMISTAAGVYEGEKWTDRRRKKEASKESKAKKEYRLHYTCSLSCPYRGKDYGPTKCKRDPRTCGHGIPY